MPITINWLDQNGTLINLTCSGQVEWHDVEKAANQARQFIRSVRHTVHLLVDASEATGLTNSLPLAHYPAVFRDVPNNLGVVVIISQKRAAQTAAWLAARLYSLRERLAVVDSPEAAFALLDAHTDKERVKNQLLHALGSGSRAIAGQAVDDLRARGWLFDGTLAGCNLTATNLQGADLTMGYLRDVKLQDSNLENAVLNQVDLQEASLRRANLFGASLVDAHLNRVVAPEADFRAAELHGCSLERANLRLSDLRGANLYGAKLWGTNLHGAKWDDSTILPDGRAWTKDDDLLPFIDASYNEPGFFNREDITQTARPDATLLHKTRPPQRAGR